MNAVITGASRGIGRAVAERFAMNGYDLFLSSRKEHGLLQSMEELRSAYPNVTIQGQAFDLSKKDQARLFGEWVLNNSDGIDVLVNNAGSFIPGSISQEEDGALEAMLEINLYTAYHTTRTLLPRMIRQQRGHIFNICSIAALAAYPNGGAYSISKFALLGFTKNLRLELQPHRIRVTAIIPGAVYTDSWKGSGVSESRIMEAGDIASAIFNATQLSPQAVVEEIILRPQLGDL